MDHRHLILEQTIGYLEKEQLALERGYLILLCSFVAILIGTVMELGFFHLYNNSFHPFAKILIEPKLIPTPECEQKFYSRFAMSSYSLFQ